MCFDAVESCKLSSKADGSSHFTTILNLPPLLDTFITQHTSVSVEHNSFCHNTALVCSSDTFVHVKDYMVWV